MVDDQATFGLTTAEVAARFRTAPGTVRYWRHTGFGPKGIRVGRRVLYPLAEIERWERSLVAGAADPTVGAA